MLKPKPFDKLSKTQLEEELVSRGEYNLDRKTKSEMSSMLSSILQGCQRVPALLFNAPTADFTTMGLSDYEMLLCEPLHDVSKHIENIFEELPGHLDKDHALLFTETVAAARGQKEVVRGVDNRMAVIKVTSVLYGKMPLNVENLLLTLCNMQMILYQSEKDRTATTILRYYNISFLHGLLCKIVIGRNTKALTQRKMYGKYFHNLITHAPLQQRLISGRSSNVENQERTFDTFKEVTKTTSNYKPDHIIGNLFIRLQAEEKLKGQNKMDVVAKEEGEISKLFECLKDKLPNTLFPYHMVRKYHGDWQAHIERISDYFVYGENVWWSQNDQGVQFFDTNHNGQKRDGPEVHHFRSSNFKKEEKYVQSHW